MSKLALTIALDNYDRHIPFFMNTVKPPEDVSLTALNVGMAPPARDGLRRHGRMFHDLEFDIAEVSLSSYILAKSRGGIPALTAAPIFPRRLFSQNQMFVNVDAGIETPGDLPGKRVGVWSFQTTLSVLAKGDLKFEYGVDWAGIRWVAQNDEEFEIAFKPGVEVTCVGKDEDIGDMLLDGRLDAIFMPHPPPQILGRPDRVRRLFANPYDECQRYYAKTGYYPIMHLLAFKQDLVDSTPWLPGAIQRCWEAAKHQAEDCLGDPAFSHALFAHQALETQRREFGLDPWPSGFATNRPNLERFITYMHDQGLIEEPMPAASLFHPAALET